MTSVSGMSARPSSSYESLLPGRPSLMAMRAAVVALGEGQGMSLLLSSLSTWSAWPQRGRRCSGQIFQSSGGGGGGDG